MTPMILVPVSSIWCLGCGRRYSDSHQGGCTRPGCRGPLLRVLAREKDREDAS